MPNSKYKKIVVDSSIWISYFKGTDSNLKTKFDNFLEDGILLLVHPVKLELLSGVKQSEIFRLGRVFQAVDFFTPSLSTWLDVEELIIKSSKKGHRFGVMDLLIAASANENKACLWSLDKDFLKMEELRLVNLLKD